MGILSTSPLLSLIEAYACMPHTQGQDPVVLLVWEPRHQMSPLVAKSVSPVDRTGSTRQQVTVLREMKRDLLKKGSIFPVPRGFGRYSKAVSGWQIHMPGSGPLA